MQEILNKIFAWTKQQAFENIISTYQNKWHCIVNFTYFAMFNRHILEKTNEEYIEAMKQANFILPDGIALKLFLQKHNIKISENLNGTDFTPYLLKNLNWKVHIGFYTVYDEKIWKKPEDAEKVEKYIQENFYPVKIFKFVSHYSHRGEDFDFKRYQESLDWRYDFKIFLVGLWTPFQEIWINKNLDFFKKNWILVMNVGGLFDFWVGFEKRAPKLIRKLNWEWAWRLLQNPKKNWQKVKDSVKLLKYLIK